MNTFFSIIIPTFNSSKFIETALNSILNQSFPNFEIIIMDGLSTDGTVEKIESFESDRIKYISKKDKGTYDAMNKGVQLSKGEWIYFLGSDDSLFSRDVLFKMKEEIASTNQKVIYGDVLIHGETGWAKDQTVYDGVFDLEKILNSNISHQAIFYHKSVFHRRLFNTEYRISADWDMNLYLRSKFDFKYVPSHYSKFPRWRIKHTALRPGIPQTEIKQHIKILQLPHF
jgi:glycosyltransferase involved in cell wall biosynthesis